jgi:hypothetical protein
VHLTVAIPISAQLAMFTTIQTVQLAVAAVPEEMVEVLDLQVFHFLVSVDFLFSVN